MDDIAGYREAWLDTAGSYWDKKDESHYCESCSNEIEREGDFEGYCGFKCWYLDGNVGAIKKIIVEALEKRLDPIKFLLKNGIDMPYDMTVDSRQRFHRAIQNRLGKTA